MRSTLAAAALAASFLSSAAFAAVPDANVYDSGGRRDPFRPAIGQDGPERDCPRDQSLKALRADEVRLHGFLRTAQGPAALIEGAVPTGSLLARPQDELCDGRVEAVDYENRVVVLRVARQDPLRPWRERILQLDRE